ncbi:hypothetical protein Q604_UNBC05025G0001, partial [human gut metagenome]
NHVTSRHEHILRDSNLLGAIRSVRGLDGILIYIGSITIGEILL